MFKRFVAFMTVAIIMFLLVVLLYNNKSYYINSVAVKTLDTFDDYIEEYRKESGVFSNTDLDKMFVTYNIDSVAVENMSDIDKFIAKMSETQFNLSITPEVDYKALEDYVTEYNKTASETKDAYIKKTEDSFAIVPCSMGDKIDLAKLESAISEGRNNLDLADFRYAPNVNLNDLADKCNNLNNFVNWSCKYANGQIISASISNVDFDDNYSPVLNYDGFEDQLKTLCESYNTVGKERNFTTSEGENITIVGGTFGTEVDKKKELEFLEQSFDNCESVNNRKPEFTLDLENIGNTYIEVSLPQQHLWYYKDGKLALESDVVTGKGSGERHATPTGVYYIMERVPGKYLKGDGYETWVDRWMRLTWGGVGLHDAKWQWAFGGTRYKTHGSHGCINLPVKFSYQLYDAVAYKTPVVIY